MTEQTIVSGGSLDLTAPLASGTDVEFLNAPAASGILRIESTAFENTTVVSDGSSVVSTYLGGAIANFQAGDTIVIANLANAYDVFDHAPSSVTASQNASVASDFNNLLTAEKYLGEDEILTIASNGSISDNTGLIEGDTLSFFGGLVKYSLPAADIGYIESYANEIEQALFQTSSVDASIFITLAPDATESTVADAYITTDSTQGICYLAGTNIMTPAGEVPVESLRIGDQVISRGQGVRAIKWIGRQNFAARFIANNADKVPVRITAGALGNGLPRRDLFVSPGHSMLLDGTLVLAKALVNGITITQPEPPADVRYQQLEFETHDCVLAEGAWSESYADAQGMRNMFHNAAEFAALFPDYVAPAAPVLCAPRPESGPALDAALRPVVALAAARVAPGAMRGFIDDVSETGLVRGWALDEANQDLPVLLELFIGGQVIRRFLACEYRGDLEEAGIARGRCSFSFTLPVAVEATKLHIRRAADGAELPMTPECAARLGVAVVAERLRA